MGESFIPSTLIEKGMVNPCLTRGVDFEAYTGPMQADKSIGDERYVVNMIGSSTVKDLQGDVMAMSALDDMTKIPDNLTLWLNHQTNDVPDSVFGGLIGRPWIKSSIGIADLHLSAEVETSNPKAMQTYNMIAKGRRLGCSIGCLVLDYEYNPDQDFLHVLHVLTIEYSVVGVPAQQRCWVEVATKSLFERALIEGDADKALQLASAVRGMYRRNYDNLVKHVTSNSLRNDLERTMPRNTAPQRIIQVFNDSDVTFALADTSDSRGITKSLKRDEVSALLEAPRQIKNTTPSYVDLAPSDLNVTDDTWELTAKSVSGKTSFPLMDIGTSWDGSKATEQIFDWARDDNGDIVASKAKQCHLYYDPDKTDTQAGYKMQYCYIVNGSPKIVPDGVRTCGKVLAGSMGGVGASDADKAGMKAKVKTMINRINNEFHPDPEWGIPWESDEKSIKEIADSNTDSALNRQDLGEEEEMPKGKNKASVEVSADGTHEAFTGSHSHNHPAYSSQGGDSNHEHSHSHDNDSNHNHSHDDAEKALEPDVQKSIDETPDPQEEAQNTTTERTEDTTEANTSPEPAITEKAATPEEQPAEDQRITLLKTMATQLGLPESVIATKGMGAISQDAISLISSIDSITDQLDDMVDTLMACFGIPDVDDNDDDSDQPGYYSYSLSPVNRVAKMFAFMLTKEGRELNEKNRKIIKSMHDYGKAVHDGASAMSPEACDCEAKTVDEATDEARMQGEGKPPSEQYSYTESIKAVNDLTKALSEIRVKSLVKDEVSTALEEAQKTLDTLNQEHQRVLREQQMIVRNIHKLKEMPLGRPTTLVGRTTVQAEDTATYEDMLSAGTTLEMSVKDLEIVQHGSMKYRVWPKGFKVGERPPLTSEQKTFMNPQDYWHYDQGTRDVLVPCVEQEARV